MALLAAYAFDNTGGSTVADLSGNGNDITLTATNGVQVTGGQTGSALGKTGATMPVLPAGLATASQTDDRTVMFDAKNDFTTWWIRWEKDSIGSGTWGVLLLSGAMQFFARRASDDGQMASRPTATTPGTTTWHNYAVTYVRSTGVATFYRDGTSVGTASFTAGTQLTTNANRINLAEWSNTGPALDNLRIYSHALTGVEVAALAGTAVTASGATGSGSLTASTAVASGAGTVSVAGTGSATATPSAAAGAGTVAVSGTGSITAPPATSAGAGTMLVAGAGTAAASASSANGSGQVLAAGIGSVSVPPSVAVGAGAVLVAATGALLASPAVVAGVGSALAGITGSGTLVAPAAVVTGSDAAPADTPPARTIIVPAESRLVVVPAESRTVEA